jgi:hypothetical protein
MDGRLTRRTLGALKAGLGKLPLRRITDARQRINRRWSQRQLLVATLCGLCAGCRNLSQVEQLTRVLSAGARRTLGLGRRVPDTTMRDLLVKISPTTMRGLLWQQARQAHRQKALRPVHFRFGAVGVDGKGTAIKSWEAGYAQKQVHGGSAKGASGLVRTFTCMLLTSQVPVCLDAAPIPPETNEDGFFSKLVDRLLVIYARSDLFRLIVADAGSCSLANAQHVRSRNLHYMFRLNEKQPTLFAEAQRLLAHLAPSEAVAQTDERVDGKTERRALFLTTEMAGFLDWTHLTTVLRVRRERVADDGKVEFVHDRYFITSLRVDTEDADQWLFLVRRYWGAVENGCHNIADAAFEEDQHPWITGNDKGMLNVLILRRIAANLLALFRGLTQRSEDRRLTPWATIMLWFFIALVSATSQQVAGLRPRHQSATTR